MDPVLAGILGGAAVAAISGWFALRQTRAAEAGRREDRETTAAMESIKVVMEGWQSLVDAKTVENARLSEENKELRAVADNCRRHHT